MATLVPYINGLMTIAENVFNVLGYLPKEDFPRLNAWTTTWRSRFGVVQAIAGIALWTIGFLAECLNRQPDPKKYLTLFEQMASLGSLTFNHGLFNIARSYAERGGFAPLLAAYDFYGRKLLPPLNAAFDVQGQLFGQIRRQLDRILFMTLMPPEFSLNNKS